MRTILVALLVLFGVAAPAARSHATTLMPMTVVDLLAHSQDIVVGQVTNVSDGFDTKGLPYTEVTLKVSDTIRGRKSDTYTFRQFGLDKPRTLPDGRVYLGRPTGWPTWRKDEVAVVFMYSKAKHTGLQTTVGLGQGKLSLANGVVMNGYENVGLFSGVRVNPGLLDASQRTMFDTKKGPVSADAFRKFLHRAVDGNWVKTGSIANAKR
jgi:hypothetical protein